jgi:hypothetical protein
MVRRSGEVPQCVFLVCAVLLASGCGGGGSTRIRMVNAVPDESNLALLVDGTSVAGSVAYGTSTGYIKVSSGSRHVQIEPSGATNVIIDQNITVPSGTDTTIVAENFSSNPPSALVLTDDNSAPSSGKFKLRIVNVAPSLGPVDVYVVTPGTDLNTVSATVSNLAFGSSTGYQSLAAGAYEIELTNLGEKFPVLDTGSQTFSSGQVRTFVGLNAQSGGFTDSILQDVN